VTGLVLILGQLGDRLQVEQLEELLGRRLNRRGVALQVVGERDRLAVAGPDADVVGEVDGQPGVLLADARDAVVVEERLGLGQVLLLDRADDRVVHRDAQPPAQLVDVLEDLDELADDDVGRRRLDLHVLAATLGLAPEEAVDVLEREPAAATEQRLDEAARVDLRGLEVVEGEQGQAGHG